VIVKPIAAVAAFSLGVDLAAPAYEAAYALSVRISAWWLTRAEREEERDENLLTASRMFAALSRNPERAHAVAAAAEEVFA
jgi:hypothetical protein